jgi:hypothetical protein
MGSPRGWPGLLCPAMTARGFSDSIMSRFDSRSRHGRWVHVGRKYSDKDADAALFKDVLAAENHRYLIRCDLAFDLQPILQFIARLSPALQINLVCAISYFLLAR